MRRRIKKREDDKWDEEPWDALKGIVPPGAQPFEFNALTLAHSWLVSAPLTLYMLAAAVFLPLVVVFGVVLLPSIFALTLLLMYVPMQLGSGRLVYCLCPCVMMTRCCRRTMHLARCRRGPRPGQSPIHSLCH